MKNQDTIIKCCGFYKDLLPFIQTLYHGHYLYVFSIGNRLKAGLSKNIIDRMANHNRNAYFYSGNELEKVAIIGPFDKIELAEYNFLYLIRKSEKFTAIHEEWYLGDFDTMVEIANELNSDFFKSKKEIKDSEFYFRVKSFNKI